MSSAAIYTESELADGLGVKRQSVPWHLRDSPPFAYKDVGGKSVPAWRIADLPAALLGRLDAEAQRQRCKGITPDQRIEILLAMPRLRWEPPIPVPEISEGCLQDAARLQSVQLPWLHRQHDNRLTPAAMDLAGVKDYARVFGWSITTRHWRDLFDRTIRRDNGYEEWSRIELYLADKLKRKPAPSGAAVAAVAQDFIELQDYIDACTKPDDPNAVECRGIWTLAFDKFRLLVQQGNPEKSAARRVRDFLSSNAPFLAATRNALRMAFDRRLERLQAASGDCNALRDGREENGEHWKFSLPEDDRDLLVHRSVFYYRGDIAPAWRDCLRTGFSPAVVSRYAGKAQKKSHVPKQIMESIASEVEILTVMYQGRRAWDAMKGHVTRSYAGINSLQCISGDDFTLNTYFYVPDGNGWFNLTRGQVILFIDFRSLRILGWALEPRKSYSSLTIRTLCTHVFGEFGVPQVLYFERGLWKTASLLKGKTDPFTMTEISQGLREFGVQFKHAIHPRTKVVERIGGMFQDIAEAEPGYCGRDERRDAPESLRKQMAQVEARNVHPEKYFYSLDQWNHRIGQLVDKYNNDPQQGHILAGMSPEQALEAHADPCNPPLQFSANMRYLLAHDKRLARVTTNGVTIQIGKQKFNYKGQEIAHLVGQEVLAWLDPEHLETIVITNQDRANPICVQRSQNPNALESIIDPDAGILGNELARIEGQASYMKTRYNVVKAKFPLPQRQMLAAARAVELGEQITAQKTEQNENATRQRRQRGQAQRLLQRTGILATENIDADRARRLQAFLSDDKPVEGKADQ